MNPPENDETAFAPAVFFERARRRLYSAPPSEATDGDGNLNPGLPTDMVFQESAVLIPVIASEPSGRVILTQRTSHLPAHAGQVAFPGGKIDPADSGPAAAALREAEEEIGLDPAAVEVVGYLDAYLTRTGYRITPVVGRVTPGQVLTLNAGEVEDAFEVPLVFLMTPSNHRIGDRLLMGQHRRFYEMPFEGRYIWGITAGIIRRLYERIYG